MDLEPAESQDVEMIDDETYGEYRIWKKNTHFLYDLVFTHALDWPSLTVQWFPEKRELSSKNCSAQSLLLGTHTSGNEQNYLMIAEVRLPLLETVIDPKQFDSQRSEIGGYGSSTGGGKVEIKVKINHDGEVNNARYMPQNPSVIATRPPNSDIYIFDYTNHPSNPNPDGKCNPEVKLKGHTKEGYGLSWNPRNSGYLLSSSYDSTSCLWDLGRTPSSGSLDPVSIFEGHKSIVEDVAWHCHHDSLFGSVGHDKRIILWNSKLPANRPTHNLIGHESDINSISFNPFNEYIFATGSSDKTIGLWDIRNLNQCVYRIKGHTDEIYNIEWSPFNETILGSCSSDRRMHVWDISKIDNKQCGENEPEHPPELLFIHGGHCSTVSDFSWNMNEDWVIASVAEDNILQIWQMSENIYTDDDEGEHKPK